MQPPPPGGFGASPFGGGGPPPPRGGVPAWVWIVVGLALLVPFLFVVGGVLAYRAEKSRAVAEEVRARQAEEQQEAEARRKAGVARAAQGRPDAGGAAQKKCACDPGDPLCSCF